MRIVARGTLRDFWLANPPLEQSLRAWYHEAVSADWSSPHDVKAAFGNASVIGDNRVVFNIAGNKYRLVVKFNYFYRVGYVRFVGSHSEYDAVDAKSV